jgi:hypothetical protein
MDADAGFDLLLDLGPQRASADRELDPMPSDTMSAPSSGSITVPSTLITSSIVGGATWGAPVLEGATVVAGAGVVGGMRCILPAKSV